MLSVRSIAAKNDAEMKLMIQQLPEYIFIFLLEFLGKEDQCSWMSCNKDWYHSILKTKIRKLILRFDSTCDGWLDKIQLLIKNPRNQVKLSINSTPTSELVNFLQNDCFAFHELQCSSCKFFTEIIHDIVNLTVTRLLIYSGRENDINVNSWQICFSKINNCSFLSLHFQALVESDIIPFLPSVVTLSLRNISFLSSTNILTYYSAGLHSLSFYDCTISDVSMLGSIPSLTFSYCNGLVDISPLTNNDQILIEKCDLVRDFSHSFTHSRKIEIILSDQASVCTIDLTKWTKVEHLAMAYYGPMENIHLQGNNHLPKTVRICDLEGTFVSLINFTITSDHHLKELTISSNDTIRSFDGYGLERVRIMECLSLNNLRSLEGIGKGKNQRIILSNCDRITDFSPLNDIPIVKIYSCQGFIDPLQVRCVRDLTIFSGVDISFKSSIADSNPYENIHSLTLVNTIRYLKEFHGLEKIPNLVLNYNALGLVTAFLEEGKQLENQRLEFRDPRLRMNRKVLLDLHLRFMKDHYEYLANSSAKWVWVRKEA